MLRRGRSPRRSSEDRSADHWRARKGERMNGETGVGWLVVALVAGAVGMGMIVYGRKQREPLPLVFGVALVAYPHLIRTAWLAAAVGVGLIVAFAAIRRYG